MSRSAPGQSVRRRARRDDGRFVRFALELLEFLDGLLASVLCLSHDDVKLSLLRHQHGFGGLQSRLDFRNALSRARSLAPSPHQAMRCALMSSLSKLASMRDISTLAVLSSSSSSAILDSASRRVLLQFGELVRLASRSALRRLQLLRQPQRLRRRILG
jgi:hypothetical protein